MKTFTEVLAIWGCIATLPLLCLAQPAAPPKPTMRHPAMRNFWCECQGGEIEEAGLAASREGRLNRAEVTAVYALARAPDERQAL
jgi:hypothetical protein